MKISIWLSAVMLACVSLTAQSDNHLVLLDFENTDRSDSTLVFGNYALDGMRYLALDNPSIDYINESASAMRYVKAPNATLQAGFMVTVPEEFHDKERIQVCFDFMSDTPVTTRVVLSDRYENDIADVLVDNRGYSQWETICTEVDIDRSKPTQNDIHYGVIHTVLSLIHI